MKKIGSIALFLFAFLSSSLALANVKVEATVDRNKVNRGETFVLTVAVSSDSTVSVNEPRLPNLTGFQLINKWSGTEARSVFTNGQFRTSRTRKFNYQLSAPNEGRMRIGQLDVVVNGRSYKTKPITIQVMASGAPTQRQAAPGGRPGFNDPFAEADDLFNQLLGRRQQALPRNRGGGGGADGDLFWIGVEIDKNRAYEGEQVTATWYLYTQGQVRDIDTLKYPSLNGFWKEDIQVATHLNFQRHVANGVVMSRALLASYALFPIKPGKVKIDPYRAKVTAIANNMGFGFGRPVKATKESKSLEVTVLPLPPGKPDNFVGVVGSFDVSASIEKRQVPVNQPVTLKVRFEGRGNAKLIELPEIKWPAELEFYDTKKESKFYKTGRSFKEFEILLIPRKEGLVEVPGLAFSIFEPKTRQYREISTQSIPLNIEPGKPGEAIPASPLADNNAGTVAPVDNDPLPKALLVWQSSAGAGVLYSPLAWLVLFGSSILVLLYRASRVLQWGQGRFDVTAKVRQRFEKAQSLVKQGDYRAVGVETMNTVYFALGDVAGEGGANIELDKLLLKVPPSVRRDLGPEIQRLMEAFQILSFAPEEVVGSLKDKDNMKKMVKDIEKVVLKAVKARSGDEDADE